MSGETLRTRFAPSPSGALHLGNVRTALYAWLHARAHGGRFVLRIEDSDATRSSRAAEQALIADLRWLGLDWDEGPDVGGAVGPYRQSERGARHRAALDALHEGGHVYRCFCSAERLATLRAGRRATGGASHYDGHCAGLSRAAAEARAGAGEAHAWRFRVAGAGAVVHHDLLLGPRSVPRASLGDFIVARSEGASTFLLANALDDADMGITEVLRGEDHLTNTVQQLLIFEALGRAPPRYGHLPLVVDATGAKLSKRRGAPALAALRAGGHLPVAIVNLLLRIGHACTEDVLHPPEAWPHVFSLARVGRAPGRFDPAQLAHWQRLAVAALGPDARTDWVCACLGDAHPEAAHAGFAAAVAPNAPDAESLRAWAARIHGPAPLPEAEAAAVIAEAGPLYFAAALAALAPGAAEPDWAALAAATGRRGRALRQPFRAALTGCLEGPELGALLALCGPARTRERLERYT